MREKRSQQNKNDDEKQLFSVQFNNSVASTLSFGEVPLPEKKKKAFKNAGLGGGAKTHLHNLVVICNSGPCV